MTTSHTLRAAVETRIRATRPADAERLLRVLDISPELLETPIEARHGNHLSNT